MFWLLTLNALAPLAHLVDHLILHHSIRFLVTHSTGSVSYCGTSSVILCRRALVLCPYYNMCYVSYCNATLYLFATIEWPASRHLLPTLHDCLNKRSTLETKIRESMITVFISFLTSSVHKSGGGSAPGPPPPPLPTADIPLHRRWTESEIQSLIVITLTRIHVLYDELWSDARGPPS
jgi:hypothetical protein